MAEDNDRAKELFNEAAEVASQYLEAYLATRGGPDHGAVPPILQKLINIIKKGENGEFSPGEMMYLLMMAEIASESAATLCDLDPQIAIEIATGYRERMRRHRDDEFKR